VHPGLHRLGSGRRAALPRVLRLPALLLPGDLPGAGGHLPV